MQERSRGKSTEQAALKVGLSVKTARFYIKDGKLPSERKKSRSWRTRIDPFAEVWSEVAKLLEVSPELEAKVIFERLTEQYPDAFQEGQLRTFQRRLKEWRAEHGPEKHIMFAQEHQPGEAFQTDFTWGNELAVTIAGQLFEHMLCHVTLPYSNWQWATICHSESMLALKRGIQAAIFTLGFVPTYNQTDNSTAATHNPRAGKRVFNERYVEFLEHFGIRPRTIAVGASNQNGDVESLNRALKRKIRQHLALRGSSDFATVQDYQVWINAILLKANKLRSRRLEEELLQMAPVAAAPLPDYYEEICLVTPGSTIRIKHNTYSVPSRLIGQNVRVKIFDDKLEIYHGQNLQLEVERLRGKDRALINYRHVIWSLIRKPGAFKRYRHREELFPSLLFRRTYDRLLCEVSEANADLEYLRILHLAAATSQHDVETAIALLFEVPMNPRFETIRELLHDRVDKSSLGLQPLAVDFSQYDNLIKEYEHGSS